MEKANMFHTIFLFFFFFLANIIGNNVYINSSILTALELGHYLNDFFLKPQFLLYTSKTWRNDGNLLKKTESNSVLKVTGKKRFDLL